MATVGITFAESWAWSSVSACKCHNQRSYNTLQEITVECHMMHTFQLRHCSHLRFWTLATSVFFFFFFQTSRVISAELCYQHNWSQKLNLYRMQQYQTKDYVHQNEILISRGGLFQIILQVQVNMQLYWLIVRWISFITLFEKWFDLYNFKSFWEYSNICGLMDQKRLEVHPALVSLRCFYTEYVVFLGNKPANLSGLSHATKNVSMSDQRILH